MLRTVIVCLLLLASFGAVASAKEPPHDVLGVRPGMSEPEVRRLLDKVGREVREERQKQKVWEVRDAHISHVIVRFSADNLVRWVTAMARREGDGRLRYADVGDTRRAEHKTDGRNHTYIWKVAARKGRPGFLVVAGGSDPQYLTSYRLTRTFE
jgi:hypothetical protein